MSNVSSSVVPANISYPFGIDWNEYFRRFFDEPSEEKVGQLEGIMRRLSTGSNGGYTCPSCSQNRPAALSRQLSLSSCPGTNVQSDSKCFEVMVDVNQFTPEEIQVNTVDNCIVVQGKHDNKLDEHGLVSRQFTRRYTVPDEFDCLSVTSVLSGDGILTIKAPKKIVPGSSGNERVVPVTLQPGRALSSIQKDSGENKGQTTQTVDEEQSIDVQKTVS